MKTHLSYLNYTYRSQYNVSLDSSDLNERWKILSLPREEADTYLNTRVISFFSSIVLFTALIAFYIFQNLERVSVLGDGNCAPRSIGAFLNEDHEEVRNQVCNEALKLDLGAFNLLGQRPYFARRFHLTA